jgi:hypothetical protein
MNLYYWNVEFGTQFSYPRIVIAFAATKEDAIQKALEQIRKNNLNNCPSYADDSDYTDYLTSEILKVEARLRTTEPIVNPLAVVIDGED